MTKAEVIEMAVAAEREAIATEFMKRHEGCKHLNNYWHHAANYVRDRGQQRQQQGEHA